MRKTNHYAAIHSIEAREEEKEKSSCRDDYRIQLQFHLKQFIIADNIVNRDSSNLLIIIQKKIDDHCS